MLAFEGEPPAEQDGDDAREVGVVHPRPPSQHGEQGHDETFPVIDRLREVPFRDRTRPKEAQEGRVEKRERDREDEVQAAKGRQGARIAEFAE